LAIQGKISVKNAQKIDADALVRSITTDTLTTSAEIRLEPDHAISVRLASNGPRIEKGLWKAGIHCQFSSAAEDALNRQINLALASQGFFFVDASIKTEPARPDIPTDLVITIKKENAPATLSKITFNGLKSTSEKEALAF